MVYRRLVDDAYQHSTSHPVYLYTWYNIPVQVHHTHLVIRHLNLLNSIIYLYVHHTHLVIKYLNYKHCCRLWVTLYNQEINEISKTNDTFKQRRSFPDVVQTIRTIQVAFEDYSVYYDFTDLL